MLKEAKMKISQVGIISRFCLSIALEILRMRKDALDKYLSTWQDIYTCYSLSNL